MTLDFPSWLRHMRLHHKQEDFAQAFAQLENFSANDASFKDLDWVTTWLWVYGSRKVETSDIFETSSSWVWMNEAFVQSTPGTLQHRALAGAFYYGLGEVAALVGVADNGDAVATRR